MIRQVQTRRQIALPGVNWELRVYAGFLAAGVAAYFGLYKLVMWLFF